MANVEHIIIAALVTTSLISTVSSTVGTATFYTDIIPSACYGSKDEGTMIAAANPSLYNNGAACGRKYRVRCTGGTNGTPHPCKGGKVTVKIVDLCEGCGHNQLDLSKQAFSRIANTDAGKIQINYKRV